MSKNRAVNQPANAFAAPNGPASRRHEDRVVEPQVSYSLTRDAEVCDRLRDVAIDSLSWRRPAPPEHGLPASRGTQHSALRRTTPPHAGARRDSTDRNRRRSTN